MPYSIIPQPGWRELTEARDHEQERKARLAMFGVAIGEARSFEADRFDALRRLEEDAENG